jgi:hypothetical protein
MKWIGKPLHVIKPCFRFLATSSLYPYGLETADTNLFENLIQIHEIVDLCRFSHGNEINRKLFFLVN